MTAADWIGAVGVSILLLGFALNLLNIISAKSYSYLLMNFSGALLAGVASYLINYVPFIILEAVWTLVSLYGIASKLLARK
jgi:hypothetical protein